jgi:hypothetical protein
MANFVEVGVVYEDVYRTLECKEREEKIATKWEKEHPKRWTRL